MASSTPSSATLYNPQEVQGMFIKGVHGLAKPIVLKGTLYPSGWAGGHVLPTFHVPGTPYVILSLSQVALQLQAHSYFNSTEAFMWTSAGVVAHARLENGLYFQQPSLSGITVDYVIKTITASLPRPTEHCILLSASGTLDTLRAIHDASNHMAYSTLRKLHHYPPADKDHPDPLCNSCMCAEMKHDNLATDASEAPSRPWQSLCADMSRKKPPDKRGNQRELVVACRFTDTWVPLFMKRKSDAGTKLDHFIVRLNNLHAPHKVASFKCDGDSVLNCDAVRSMLTSYGVFFSLSAPDEQRANPAESVMHRHGKSCLSTAFRCCSPKSDWSLISSHVAKIHNSMDRVGRSSPDVESTGIRSSWNPLTAPPFGSQCWARLYNRGKEERKAVECVYLGQDYHCNAAIVRPINGRLASQTNRYSKVTKHDASVFPYVHPNVC